jgi:hypothetical protein
MSGCDLLRLPESRAETNDAAPPRAWGLNAHNRNIRPSGEVNSVEMNESILFMIAGGVVLFAAMRWMWSLPPAVENELCWSCGQRGQHKLWCPNR